MERAAVFARGTGEPAYIWRTNTLAGQLHLALHEPDRARAAFEESIAAIEDVREHLGADDVSAAAFLEDKTDAYHGMVALLVQGNRPMEALAMAERAKARVLVDLLTGPQLDPVQAMTADERASARRHTEEIASLNRQIADARAAVPPAPAALRAELDAKLTAARRARDDTEEDFFIAHPELRNRRPPIGDKGLDDHALRGLLADGRTVLLEYVVSADATFLFTVTKAKDGPPDAPPVVRARRLPLDRASLSTRTEEFRDMLAERGIDWEAQADALGKDLLDPVQVDCADADRLVIVADGPLWELPFQALIVGGRGTVAKPSRTLGEAHTLDYAPSLTVLARTIGAPLDQPPRLLACGNPALAIAAKNPASEPTRMDDETRPLPDAERQVKALADLYGAAHSLVLGRHRRA